MLHFVYARVFATAGLVILSSQFLAAQAENYCWRAPDGTYFTQEEFKNITGTKKTTGGGGINVTFPNGDTRRYLSVPCPQSANSPVKFFIGAGGGWVGSNSTFNVPPSFDVNGSNGIGFLNGGVLFPTPIPGLSVGPAISFFGGNIRGSISQPPASPGFDYQVKTSSIVTTDVEFEFVLPKGNTFGLYNSSLDASLDVEFGAATGKTSVTGTSGTFIVNDSHTSTGFTTAFGFSIPIPNTPVSVATHFRYINLPTATFNIPGSVPIDRNIYIATGGLVVTFPLR